MIICIDKITCVRMYDLIAGYWTARIAALERELAHSRSPPPSQGPVR